jgi:hypothetical protein
LRYVKKWVECGSQLFVAPLFIGSSECSYNVVRVTERRGGGLPVSKDIKEAVPLDGASGECQPECGLEEEPGGLCFEGGGVALGPTQGDSVQRRGVVFKISGVLAQAVEEVSDDAGAGFRRECFCDEGGGSVRVVETVPAGKEGLGRAKPESRGGKCSRLGEEWFFAAEICEGGGLSAAGQQCLQRRHGGPSLSFGGLLALAR